MATFWGQAAQHARVKRSTRGFWRHLAIAAMLAVVGAAGAQAAEREPLGIAMEGYRYPYPVHFHDITYHGELLRMAYMDVAPTGEANGRTAVLLHGANFFGGYWGDTAAVLAAAGFRVIVPDQIGFGKSAKPDLPYAFHWLANNTKGLLDALGVSSASVVGHSMGGMVATRFALMFPDMTERLVLENPIGLEDYREKVPWVPVDRIFQSLLKRTEDDIRSYHQTYYVTWQPAFDAYVQVHARWSLSGEFPRLARARALIAQMIYEQPVVHELPLVRPPTLLIIGQEDRTALGKARVAPDVRATLGHYPTLGRQAAAAIPDATLVALDAVGHIPHLESSDRFHQALLNFLAR